MSSINVPLSLESLNQEIMQGRRGCRLTTLIKRSRSHGWKGTKRASFCLLRKWFNLISFRLSKDIAFGRGWKVICYVFGKIPQLILLFLGWFLISLFFSWKGNKWLTLSVSFIHRELHKVEHGEHCGWLHPTINFQLNCEKNEEKTKVKAFCM